LNDYLISVHYLKDPSVKQGFQTKIQPQRPGGFSIASQRAPIGRLVNIFLKQTLNIPLSIVKLLITLWMVYQHTQSLQRYKDTGILPDSVAGEEENRSGISP
jgi:hypothetical protein